MDPVPRPPAPVPLLSRVVVVLLVLGVAAYVVFLARNVASYASGSDSSGYFNSARLLVHGEFFATPRLPAGTAPTEFGLMAFQPLGFIMDANAPRMAPTYPTGLPLHLLLAARFTGWRYAATLVNIAATLAAGWLMWLLARRLALPRWWACAGVALLWLCPVYLFTVLQPMSDLLALLWSLAVLYAVLRARDHRPWALAGGAALALAVLVRPTDLLLVLPVVLALGRDWRSYLLFGLGGLPGAAFFAYYNRQVYGSPLATGYGEIWTAFSVAYVPHNLAHMARWLPVLLTPLVGAALAVPFLRAARNRAFAVLGTWAVILTGFYAFYYHTGETWWYLRFILPAFPVLILLALFALRALLERLPAGPAWLAPAAAFGLLVFAVGWNVRQDRLLEVAEIPRGERFYLDTAEWAKARLPPGAAVFCMQVSGALFYYTDLQLVRWDQVQADRVAALLARLQAQHRPVYAALYDFEEADFRSRIGGHWEKLATVGNTTFWKLSAGP
jgi:hypothetical protein